MAEVYLGVGRTEILQASEGLQLNSTAATLEYILAWLDRLEARLVEHERRVAATLPSLRPEPDPPDGPPLYATAQQQFQFTYHQQPPLTSAATTASLLHQTHQPPSSYVLPLQTTADPTARFHNYPQLPQPYLQQRPQPYHHDYPQLSYTYKNSYVQQQYSSAGYHSWQHEYQPSQPPSQPLLAQSDRLLQPPQPQPPSCSHRRSATAPFPFVVAAPDSTPTYSTSAIPPAAITQSRSCPEHPVVVAVPPPPQATISSTCGPDRIDTLSLAPLPIVPPPQAVLSPPCSLKMINIAVQHKGKSSILDGEIETILPNQGTIGRIASRSKRMIMGVDYLHDINMGQVQIILKDTYAFDPGGSTREACY